MVPYGATRLCYTQSAPLQRRSSAAGTPHECARLTPSLVISCAISGRS